MDSGGGEKAKGGRDDAVHKTRLDLRLAGDMGLRRSCRGCVILGRVTELGVTINEEYGVDVVPEVEVSFRVEPCSRSGPGISPDLGSCGVVGIAKVKT